jgi:hypothetical protein
MTWPAAQPNRVWASFQRRGMLAYYVEWRMRQALKPILFDDHDKVSADAARTSIVAKAKRSEAANAKAATKRTDEGLPSTCVATKQQLPSRQCARDQDSALV